jgi:lipopolysaccharide transport system permease protein
MREFATGINEMFATLWRNRSLIAAAAKREVLGRYRGSLFGLL